MSRGLSGSGELFLVELDIPRVSLLLPTVGIFVLLEELNQHAPGSPLLMEKILTGRRCNLDYDCRAICNFSHGVHLHCPAHSVKAFAAKSTPAEMCGTIVPLETGDPW